MLNQNFLSPIDDTVISHLSLNSSLIIGNTIDIYTADSSEFPDYESADIAIIGVNEYRNQINNLEENHSLNDIRSVFYNLYPGNWNIKIVDLGNLILGNSVADTYMALQNILTDLLKLKVIPIIIGGSQDITYSNYRSYDFLERTVNIANIDSNFDLGDSSKPIGNNNYLGKIILEKPHNLFNYSVLGYQTYFNPQEEIDLMDKLYFEAYRLGDLSKINNCEPILRDANIVTLDLKSVRSSELGSKQKFSPNGFSGKEICAISRYAGISNKVSSFGIYEYTPSLDNEATEILISQIIWYFIEGFNCRVNDNNFKNHKDFQRFTLLIEKEEIIFLKSLKSLRWWIEIPLISGANNKLKEHSLLPCMHEDYLNACQGIIPERWYKAQKKNII